MAEGCRPPYRQVLPPREPEPPGARPADTQRPRAAGPPRSPRTPLAARSLAVHAQSVGVPGKPSPAPPRGEPNAEKRQKDATDYASKTSGIARSSAPVTLRTGKAAERRAPVRRDAALRAADREAAGPHREGATGPRGDVGGGQRPRVPASPGTCRGPSPPGFSGRAGARASPVPGPAPPGRSRGARVGWAPGRSLCESAASQVAPPSGFRTGDATSQLSQDAPTPHP